MNLIEVKDRKTHIDISIIGNLDGDLSLEKTVLPKGLPVYFDLGQLVTMNSVGIRDWLNWCKNYSEEKWYFSNCPPFFIKQINLLEGFLPRRSRIDSLYVPFYSANSGEEKNILVTRAENYTNGNTVQLPDVLDSLGEKMIIDVAPEKYFKFLYTY